MKLLVLIVIVGLVEICSSASIPATTESSEESSDESDWNIEHLREILEMIPGMDSTSIDDIIKKFQLFHEISIDTEDLESGVYFLSLAIDAEFAKVYRAVFAFRLGFIEEYILNADSNEDDDYSSAEEMEKELQRLEEEFLKELTQSQTEHAMRIIRGNGEYTTQENQSDEDEFDFLLSMDHFSKTTYENNELLDRK